MDSDSRDKIARRRLVSQLAARFHEGMSNDQVRAHYADGISVVVDGAPMHFPASLLDDEFLEKARELYRQMISAHQTRH